MKTSQHLVLTRLRPSSTVSSPNRSSPKETTGTVNKGLYFILQHLDIPGIYAMILPALL